MSSNFHPRAGAATLTSAAQPCAVSFHLHGVAAEGGTETASGTSPNDRMPLKRRRLVVLGRAAFGIEGVQVRVLHLLGGFLVTTTSVPPSARASPADISTSRR